MVTESVWMVAVRVWMGTEGVEGVCKGADRDREDVDGKRKEGDKDNEEGDG